MGLSQENFLRLLQDLLPRGLAWPREPQADLTDLMDGLAAEYCRLDARTTDFLNEMDPRNTTELVEDWERLLGLPDECTGEQTSLASRRAEIVAKLTAQGSLNPQFYIDFAARLGYTITIYEYRQFQAGRSVAGDPVSNGPWVHVWQVNAEDSVAQRFSAGQNFAGDPLAVYADAVLECAITKRKPAHTIVLFTYGG